MKSMSVLGKLCANIITLMGLNAIVIKSVIRGKSHFMISHF
jgi:hypothetical protein